MLQDKRKHPEHFDYKTKAIAQKKCQDFLYEWFNDGHEYGQYDEFDKKYDWHGGYGGGSEPEVDDVTIGEACRHWAWNSLKNTERLRARHRIHREEQGL